MNLAIEHDRLKILMFATRATCETHRKCSVQKQDKSEVSQYVSK